MLELFCQGVQYWGREYYKASIPLLLTNQITDTLHVSDNDTYIRSLRIYILRTDTVGSQGKLASGFLDMIVVVVYETQLVNKAVTEFYDRS